MISNIEKFSSSNQPPAQQADTFNIQEKKDELTIAEPDLTQSQEYGKTIEIASPVLENIQAKVDATPEEKKASQQEIHYQYTYAENVLSRLPKIGIQEPQKLKYFTEYYIDELDITIDGHEYTVNALKLLGEGSYGAVYEAIPKDGPPLKPLVVKIMTLKKT